MEKVVGKLTENSGPHWLLFRWAHSGLRRHCVTLLTNSQGTNFKKEPVNLQSNKKIYRSCLNSVY